MDRVSGATLGDRALTDPTAVGAVLGEMVRLQLLLHAAREPRLRPLKAKLAEKIGLSRMADPALMDRLTAQLHDLPDGDSICHGDFHPFNIIGEGNSATIVDWLDATSGPPAADACRSYLLLKQGAPAGFADAYLDRYTLAGGVERDAVLAWLPLLAAARLAEGVEGEADTLLGIARSGS
jgi:aminoglycoside phosphotransferase (APT) family kinase protein